MPIHGQIVPRSNISQSPDVFGPVKIAETDIKLLTKDPPTDKALNGITVFVDHSGLSWVNPGRN